MESEKSTCFEDLPEGLVMDILSRLPVQSLIQSTSVCKEWYSIIKSVSFISLHLSRSVSDLRSYVFLNSHSYMYSLVKDNHLLTHDSPECSIFKFSIGDNPRKIYISSCRGLVCLTDWWWDGEGYGIYLFNPFVRKYKEIELESSCYADLIRDLKPDKRLPSKCDLIQIDFGYSEIEDDYKVLRMIITKNKEKSATKVEIYSLKSSKWECVDLPTEIEIDTLYEAACVLGSLYWVIQNDTRYLLCFDLKAHVFSKIELPKPYLELPMSKVFNKNDSLVILLHEKLQDCVSGELEMCLLTLEEKNLEGHKWKECYYTLSCDDWESHASFNPFGFTIGGRLILNIHKEFSVMDQLSNVLGLGRRRRNIYSYSDSDSDDDCDNEKDTLFEVDLDNDCAIEKFGYNFSELVIKGYDIELIDGATNVLESLVLFSS